MKKTHIFIILAITILFVLVTSLNKWIAHQVDSIVDQRLSQQEEVNAQNIEDAKESAYQQVIKELQKKKVVIEKVRMDPNRQYEFHLFFLEKLEVAKYKTDNQGRIYEIEGKIPDGLVRFTNDYRKTYGQSYYKNNNLHGFLKEHYENGKIRREAKYIKGILKTNKEYFFDGVLRFEANYEDTLKFVENKKLELGIGKIYYRDGGLMYEWHLTNSDRKGFNKSYDQNGRLVEENIFNEFGEKLESWDYRKMEGK